MKAILTDDGVFTVSGTGGMNNYSYTATPWYSLRADIHSVIIQQGVTSVGDYAFTGCTALTSLTMPDSAVSVGTLAFAGCTGLTSVDIPSSVKNIGQSAFSGCTGLTSIEIPQGVESVEYGVFESCENLRSVKMPSSVKTIGANAFNGCVSLRSVEMPSSVTSVGTAFSGCTELKTVTVTGGSLYRAIDAYFSTDETWKLPGMSDDTIVSLTLRDISSLDYDPNNDDGRGGIAGDAERELHYKDAEYRWVAGKWTKVYAVTLEKGTGIDEFAYILNDGFPTGYTEPFTVTHGDTLILTALLPDGYSFDKWSVEQGSSVPDSINNPLTVPSVSGKISLTAYASLIPVPPSPSDTYYRVAFSSGSYYTVYAENGSPVSSTLTVKEGGSLTFGIQASEGYTAYPSVVSGSAKITTQADGRYRISDIRSDVSVAVTVSAVSGSGSGGNSGGDSGEGSGNGSGNGSDRNSDGDSERDGGISYLVPVLIAAVLIICAAFAFILFLFKRRKDEEEEDDT
ncbi:MAG: leucine-rich repeat domain-containing protein [Candidatus Methanoplasma sp.]|nr:leucine-rich repeat domain-containing protein [Candidatus Methanoplasma sp.]